jgi:DNA repair protein RecO (recombination protein O)
VAKGSRRSRSALVGLLEPFTHLHAQFARGKTLDPITQARPLTTFPDLRTDLDRLTHGAYLLELWSSCLPEREAAPLAFTLLLKGLQALQHPDIDPGLLCRWLELHLLDELGYGPDFATCHQCQRATLQGWFSPEEGQLTCPACGPTRRTAKRLGPKLIKSIHYLRRLTLPQLQGRKPDPELSEELESVLRDHLQHHWPSRAPKVLHL